MKMVNAEKEKECQRIPKKNRSSKKVRNKIKSRRTQHTHTHIHKNNEVTENIKE